MSLYHNYDKVTFLTKAYILDNYMELMIIGNF